MTNTKYIRSRTEEDKEISRKVRAWLDQHGCPAPEDKLYEIRQARMWLEVLMQRWDYHGPEGSLVNESLELIEKLDSMQQENCLPKKD